MVMVVTDAVVVEARLLTGDLGCPSCWGVLRPWVMLVGGFPAGWKALCGIGLAGRSARVGRRPSVLLPAGWLSRRGTRCR
jgi:hypothetical protein